MATFDNNPLYSLPSSPFAEALWMSWNADASPVSSQDDGSLEMDSNWHPPIYSMPEYYCLPLEKWSDQPTAALSSCSLTGNSISMGQFSDNRIDVNSWVPAIDAFTAPVFSATPVAPSCTPDLTPQCHLVHDCSSVRPGTTTPSNHTSPSASNSNLPSPVAAADSNTKTNRVTKTSIRCWEHSCGGRAFSSLGNYERHLREKSGRAKSFSCEQCGQRFTRSTAKNKHIRYGRCRVPQVRYVKHPPKPGH
ncbi:hypothetical protein BJX76DRAFT_331464 [Aspergillus varians]